MFAPTQRPPAQLLRQCVPLLTAARHAPGKGRRGEGGRCRRKGERDDLAQHFDRE
jgi:hypothetical protein